MSIGKEIDAQISVLMSRKRCPDCLKQYSPNSVLFEIFEGLKPKSTVFSAKSANPMYIRQGSYNRLVGSKPKAISYEPSLCLKITCHCGYCQTMAIKNKQ